MWSLGWNYDVETRYSMIDG